MKIKMIAIDTPWLKSQLGDEYLWYLDHWKEDIEVDTEYLDAVERIHGIRLESEAVYDPYVIYTALTGVDAKGLRDCLRKVLCHG